jgi:hypothetical protein
MAKSFKGAYFVNFHSKSGRPMEEYTADVSADCNPGCERLKTLRNTVSAQNWLCCSPRLRPASVMTTDNPGTGDQSLIGPHVLATLGPLTPVAALPSPVLAARVNGRNASPKHCSWLMLKVLEARSEKGQREQQAMRLVVRSRRSKGVKRRGN